jgi:hypothetical protein
MCKILIAQSYNLNHVNMILQRFDFQIQRIHMLFNLHHSCFEVPHIRQNPSNAMQLL